MIPVCINNEPQKRFPLSGRLRAGSQRLSVKDDWIRWKVSLLGMGGTDGYFTTKNSKANIPVAMTAVFKE